MSKTVGITIPAYKPDISRLNSYIESIRELDFATTIHIELDAPDSVDTSSIVGYDSMNIAEERRGKGKAISDGFDFLLTDVLAFADADGATPASSLQKVIRPVKNGDISMSVGSRRHPKSDIQDDQSTIRRILGDIFARMARHSSSVSLHDYQCGAKALLSEVWETIRSQVYESGFAFDFELIELVSSTSYNIREIPISWSNMPRSTVRPIRDSVLMGIKLYTISHRSMDTTEINGD